jgi:hypothetical protein
VARARADLVAALELPDDATARPMNR